MIRIWQYLRKILLHRTDFAKLLKSLAQKSVLLLRIGNNAMTVTFSG